MQYCIRCFYYINLSVALNDIQYFQKMNYLGGFIYYKETHEGASLVAQRLRIRLPMQGTWVRSLVREDPTGRRATKPVRRND